MDSANCAPQTDHLTSQSRGRSCRQRERAATRNGRRLRELIKAPVALLAHTCRFSRLRSPNGPLGRNTAPKFRLCHLSLRCRGVRRWLSQHIRRSMCSRRVAASYARSERMSRYVQGISPVRPISSMEPAIHDVHSLLNGWTRHAKAAAGAGSATASYALLSRPQLPSAIDRHRKHQQLKRGSQLAFF